MLKGIVIILFMGFLLNLKAVNYEPRFDFQTRYTLNEKWTNLSSLGYVRYIDDNYPGYRWQLRSSMTRVLKPNTALLFGLYVHFIDDQGSARYALAPDTASISNPIQYLELRPWVGYKFHINALNWLKLDNFIRYEYRGNIALNSDYQNYSSNVLRYRILAVTNIFKSNKNTQTLGLNVGAEFFASITAGLNGLYYNRARILCGLNYKATKKWEYSIDFAQEYNQSGQLDLSDFNTLIIFMKVRRTLFSKK